MTRYLNAIKKYRTAIENAELFGDLNHLCVEKNSNTLSIILQSADHFSTLFHPFEMALSAVPIISEEYLIYFQEIGSTLGRIYEEVMMQAFGVLRNMQNNKSVDAQSKIDKTHIEEIDTCADNLDEANKQAKSLRRLIYGLGTAPSEGPFIKENKSKIEKVSILLSLLSSNTISEEFLTASYDNEKKHVVNIRDQFLKFKRPVEVRYLSLM